MVHAQMAHLLAQQGKHAETLERYAQLMALDLQSDTVTAALCTSNMLALKAQTSESVPKVRRWLRSHANASSSFCPDV